MKNATFTSIPCLPSSKSGSIPAKRNCLFPKFKRILKRYEDIGNGLKIDKIIYGRSAAASFLMSI